MSQTNTQCRKCKMPRMPNHSFAGFDEAGTPIMKCGRDPKDGADEILEALNRLWADSDAKDEADILNGVRALWSRGDHQDAADLLMGADSLRTRLQAAEGRITATDEMLDRKTSDLSEALTRVANLEREKTALKIKVAQHEEERKAAVEATGADAAKRIAELDLEVARLRGDNRNLAALLIDAAKRVEAAEARPNPPQEARSFVPLERPKKPNVAAKEVSPPPPEAPVPAPAPVAVARTKDACECCGKPASMIAENAFPLKAGGFYDAILSCKFFGSHLDEILAVLSSERDLLVDPPKDTDQVRAAFKNISPTPNA